MTTSEQATHDVADDGVQHGDQAMELADRIRMVAAQDPELAQDLVDQLIAALDRATDGTFREHLGAAEKGATDWAVPASRPASTELSSPRNS